MKKFFAKRTDWPRQPNALGKAYQQLKSEGAAIIDLTASNPTACKIDYPDGFLDGFLRGLCQKQAGQYRPDSLGLAQARCAVSEFYALRGFKIDPGQIILTSSTSEAYNYLFRLLANYGDHVLFPQPSYPLFSFLGDLNDIVLSRYKLDEEKDWSVDFHDLKAQVNDYTKAIVLVNPNNPTGSYTYLHELKELNRLCASARIPIISDEVFWDYALDVKDGRVSLIENKDVLTFTLGGLSKTLGLPQMKLSWIVVSGPLEERQEALSRLEILADTFLSVNTPVQLALTGWLKRADQFQQPIQQRIKSNYDFLKAQFADVKRSRLFNIQGGWYAIISVNGMRSEEGWALKLLNKYHIFVHPGYFFDFHGEKSLVISLLCETGQFKEGVARLISRMEQEVA